MRAGSRGPEPAFAKASADNAGSPPMSCGLRRTGQEAGRMGRKSYYYNFSFNKDIFEERSNENVSVLRSIYSRIIIALFIRLILVSSEE